MPELSERLRDAYANSTMVGWDFSRLEGRMTATQPNWDFEGDCRAALARSRRAVDLGTGGGERLISLLGGTDPEPATLFATEGWEPNLPVARRNLEPHGIEVRRYDADAGDQMPFDSGSLDLIMSRHEAYDVRELARTIVPGGRFLTQQVHGHDSQELRDWFGGDVQYPHVTLEQMTSELRDNGFQLELAEEWKGPMTFDGTESLVEYMGLVPWDVPEFTVDNHLATLETLESQKPIQITQMRFRIYASRIG